MSDDYEGDVQIVAKRERIAQVKRDLANLIERATMNADDAIYELEREIEQWKAYRRRTAE